MGKLFGTDGIRGVANKYPMTPEMALKVGQAVGLHFGGNKRSAILIGRDTRISGQMIESALVAGCCSVGVDVTETGIMPTPGVAYLTRATGASAGIVVSASHNPYYDNGIKLFDSNGFKLSEKIEETLEKRILDNGALSPSKTNSKIGKVTNLTDHEERYKDHLKSCLSETCRFSDFKVALDCANGATHRIAPILFTDLGSSVETFFNLDSGFFSIDMTSSNFRAVNMPSPVV
jgi:phosphoglucosamine mutase